MIALSVMVSLQDEGLEKMWIYFGQGKNTRWVPIHDLLCAVGPNKARGLPFFHAFTGCDVVSAFRGKERKQHGRPGMFLIK